MFLIKQKNDSKLNLVIRNFLSYVISNYKDYSKEFITEYESEDLKKYIYNCALNTIDEYTYTKKLSSSTLLSTLRIIDLFKENLMLRQFDRKEIAVDYSENTKEILTFFKTITEYDNLDISLRDNILKNVNEIIASTR
jgi:hypothetical protein